MGGQKKLYKNKKRIQRVGTGKYITGQYIPRKRIKAALDTRRKDLIGQPTTRRTDQHGTSRGFHWASYPNTVMKMADDFIGQDFPRRKKETSFFSFSDHRHTRKSRSQSLRSTLPPLPPPEPLQPDQATSPTQPERPVPTPEPACNEPAVRRAHHPPYLPQDGAS